MVNATKGVMHMSFPEAVRLIANYRETSSEMLMLEFCSEAMCIDPDALMSRMINPAELACAWTHDYEQNEAMALKARLRPSIR